MKKIVVYLVLFLAGTLTLTAQKIFEGTITYSYEISGENAQMMKSMMPESMVIQYSKAGMTTKMKGGMMARMLGTIVVNADKKESFVVKEDEKAIYLIKEEDTKDAASTNAKEVTKMDEQEDILGYTCERYKIVAEQEGQEMTQYVWVTDAFKVPEINTPGMQQMGNGLVNSDKIPGFPMRVEVSIPAVGGTMIMTAAELQPGNIPASTFERPAGFAVKDFSEMLNMGMGN